MMLYKGDFYKELEQERFNKIMTTAFEWFAVIMFPITLLTFCDFDSQWRLQ